MGVPSWITPFAQSSYQLFIHHDPAAHLPFDAWGLHPLYNDLWLEKLFELVQRFSAQGYRIRDQLSAFPNFSSTRFLILMTMIHYQTSQLDRPELVTTIEDFLLEALEARSQSDDLFAFTTNRDMTEQEVRTLIRARPLQPARLDESREIGKILVALASLTHGLYNDWCTDFNYEITGPYSIDGQTVLLRSFQDVHPDAIWKGLSWPYHHFSILTNYQNLQATIAFVGCHIIYSASTIDHLTGYHLLVDGREIQGLEALGRLREALMPLAAAQFEKFLTMDFEDQKITYLYQEHYQFKKLFELVGMDWQPSPRIRERVKGQPLITDVFPSYALTFEGYQATFGVNKLIAAYQQTKVDRT